MFRGPLNVSKLAFELRQYFLGWETEELNNSLGVDSICHCRPGIITLNHIGQGLTPNSNYVGYFRRYFGDQLDTKSECGSYILLKSLSRPNELGEYSLRLENKLGYVGIALNASDITCETELIDIIRLALSKFWAGTLAVHRGVFQ